MSDNNQPTLEQLQASYAEAQRKITELATQNANLKKAPKAPEPPATPIQDTSFLGLNTLAAKNNLDTDSLQAEFLANGGNLTAATKQALIAKGFASELIETMIGAFRARAEQQTKAAIEVLGSQEQLDKFMEWAGGLPADKKKALNAGLRSNAWEEVLTGFNNTRLKDPTYKEPTNNQQARTNSQPSGPSGDIAFSNIRQQNQAIQHKDYATNKDGYREKVLARIRYTQQHGFKDYRQAPQG